MNDNFNIEKESIKIKNDSIENKRKYIDFLENYIIDKNNNIGINNWIIKNIWNIENNYINIKNPDYTYWFSGGTSWSEIYNFREKYTKEENISLSQGNNILNYIYVINNNNTDNFENKIKRIYEILKELQVNLSNDDINDIEIIYTKNIEINDNNEFKFNYYKDKTQYNKPSIFNLKLKFKNNQLGGARPPKKRNTKGFLKLIKEQKILEQQGIIKNNNNKQLLLLLNNTFYYAINNIKDDKNIFEINFEVYNSKFDGNDFVNSLIEKINDNYLNISKIKNNSNDILVIKSQINKLNNYGMMTYSYLTLTDKSQDMGLNIEEYRQQIFLNKELKNNKIEIKKFLEKIKNKYEIIYKNTKFYNIFFIEKLDNLILNNTIENYDNFISFIEKLFITIFRPAINSFIIEINNELEEKYGLKLFIAGGDAMRRYKNNISFTKDIDTKLYIGKNNPNKQDIIIIIAKHIVKLRNYLEENYTKMLEIQTLRIDENNNKITDILNYSNEKIKYFYKDKNNNKYECIINLTYPDEKTKKSYQQFRVREIKKSNLFPVDLYSIDFQTIINYSGFNNIKEEKKINISILDVVLEEGEYKNTNYTIVNNIPVASLDFLIADLEKTYTIPDRALARISSGKYKKDIERYNELIRIRKDINDGIKEEIEKIPKIENINYEEIRNNVSNKINDKTKETYIFIYLHKLENNIQFNIFDIIIVSNILDDIVKLYDNNNDSKKEPSRYNNNIKELFNIANNIANFKINIYNEDLQKILNDYNDYIEKNQNEIIENYYKLFESMILSNDDKQKHIISFSNTAIKGNISNYIIDNIQSITDSKKRTILSNDKKTKKQRKSVITPPISPKPIETNITTSSRGRVRHTPKSYKEN